MHIAEWCRWVIYSIYAMAMPIKHTSTQLKFQIWRILLTTIKHKHNSKNKNAVVGDAADCALTLSNHISYSSNTWISLRTTGNFLISANVTVVAISRQLYGQPVAMAIFALQITHFEQFLFDMNATFAMHSWRKEEDKARILSYTTNRSYKTNKDENVITLVPEMVPGKQMKIFQSNLN